MYFWSILLQAGGNFLGKITFPSWSVCSLSISVGCASHLGKGPGVERQASKVQVSDWNCSGCTYELTAHQSWNSRNKIFPFHNCVSSDDIIQVRSTKKTKYINSESGWTQTVLPGTYSSVFPYIFLASAANHLLNPIQRSCCFFELRSSDKKKNCIS